MRNTIKHHFYFYTIFICALFFTSCIPEEEEIDQQFIEEQLDKDIREYIKLIQFGCSDALLFEVEKEVDSIMREQTDYLISGSSVFPDRPAKPNYDYPIVLDDTTEILPVLIDSFIQRLSRDIINKDLIKRDENTDTSEQNQDTIINLKLSEK